MSTATNDVGVTGDTRSADPRAYARILWRWKFVLLAFLVVIPVAAYLYERSRPKVYQSSALMEISGGPSSGVASLLNQVAYSGPDTTDLLIDARLLTTPVLARQAASLLRPRANPRSLAGTISTSADQTTGFLTIKASANSPQRAAAIANAFARALVRNDTRAAVRQINAAISQLQQEIAAGGGNAGNGQLAQQLAHDRALRAAQGGGAQLIQPATASASPVSPRVTRSVILALIVALLLGLGAVALAETSDRRIRHPDEAGDYARLPLLSAIPASAFSPSDRSHEVEESFITLRSSLTYFNIDRTVSSVLITSPAKEEGKTTVAVWLAHSLAQAGKDVILLETDLRRPSIAKWLGIPPSYGLGPVLVDEVGLDQALLTHGAGNDAHGRLRILPAGRPPPNPSELLGSGRMRELMSELTERSDILVIDSTPLLTVSDSMPLVRLAGGVVLVARINRTSRDAIARLRFVVESAGGNPLGVVATGARSGGLYAAPGYGYESAYATANGANGSGGPRRPRFRGRRAPDDAKGVGVGELE